MHSTAFAGTSHELPAASIQDQIDSMVSQILGSFPEPSRLSAEQRRGILARYTAVLEGNFIYWMTGAYLAARSDETRSIIWDNLHEEVRDAHPEMLRKFALAAHAAPTDADAAAVYPELTQVRRFIGKLSAVKIVLMMGFFEKLIQQWMPYMADLAGLQGSTEREYTDVHGVCDVAHSQELFRALDVEMALDDAGESEASLFEGVDLLRGLIKSIVQGAGVSAAAAGRS